VQPVLAYVYAPASDNQHVLDLMEQMADGRVDVLVFTSAPQVERLFGVAASHRKEDQLRRGLEKTRIAAVGPIVAEALRRHAAPVHICPEQGFVMKNLVQHIKRAFNT
jgi:uroporphyrinogen-III synthase